MNKLKKRKDNRYQKLLPIGKDENGKVKRKALYANNRSELMMKVAEFLTANDPVLISHSITVRELAERWIDEVHAGSEYNTLRTYQEVINGYITPMLGDCCLKDLTRSQLQKYLNVFIKTGRDRTAEKNYQTMNQMFEMAKIDGYISINPLEKVKKPIYHAPEREPLSDSEIEIMLSANLTLKERVFILILLDTGIRLGEILALKWENIDLERKYLHVKITQIFIKNRPVEKDRPKSLKSIRSIPITDRLVNLLTAYRQMVPSNAAALVFTNYEGKRITQQAYKRFWQKVCRKFRDAGLDTKGVTAHLFRHTYATDLIAAGVDIKTLQYLLGHANANVSANIYAHFKKEHLEESRAKINSNKRSAFYNASP